MANFALKSTLHNSAYSTPKNTVVFAIGDIHAELDLLIATVKALKAKKVENSHNVLVLMGDYIDRGKNSAKVISYFVSKKLSEYFDEVHYLMGNHEYMLYEILHAAKEFEKSPATDEELQIFHKMCVDWLRNGGVTTLNSYDIPIEIESFPKLHKLLPASHIKFISKLVFSVNIGGYLFVHAGVKPNVKLSDQDFGDLLWIRQEFLSHDSPYYLFETKTSIKPMMVVHGHTITTSDNVSEHRIALDTGAYTKGKLSSVMLRDNTIRFFTLRRS